MSAFYFGTETAFYAEDEMTLGEKVTASVGLRDVLFGVKGRVYNRLEPRVALSYRPSDLAALKVSYTEMNQFSHRLVTSYLDLPSAIWLPSTAKVAPMHSKQVAAGIYMTLPFNLQIDLEGFYKTMDHIREYKGYRIFPPIENWERTFAEHFRKLHELPQTQRQVASLTCMTSALSRAVRISDLREPVN